jgi:hypothetical protein
MTDLLKHECLPEWYRATVFVSLPSNSILSVITPTAIIVARGTIGKLTRFVVSLPSMKFLEKRMQRVRNKAALPRPSVAPRSNLGEQVSWSGF